MKQVRFLGDSLKRIRDFPEKTQKKIGLELRQVQFGLAASDVKPMVGLGSGVEEIRVWDESGTFRVVYVARFIEAIYVIHVFQKKTQATAKRDLMLIRNRLDELRRMRDEL